MGVSEMTKTAGRQGNIELLRILCMFFVMLFHFNLNVILRNEETSHELNYFALFVNSLVVVAVNTFVLISGYFSIKLKTKSILAYLVQTEFYAAIAILILVTYSVSEHGDFVIITIASGLMPFHPHGLWFVPCYALLMVISPLLNWVCEDKKTHFVTMSIIAVGGVILYMAGRNEGYGITNFLLLYFIGRWIALYAKDNSKKQQWCAALTLFLSVAITFGLAILWVIKDHSVENKTMFAYCSPWVITSSVALFLVFKNITINKLWIAYIAPSVFSVYLFHENSLINQIVYIKPLRFVISIIPYDTLSYLAIVVYGIILFALIVAFDRCVRLNIQEWIMNALSNFRILKIIDSKLLKLNE